MNRWPVSVLAALFAVFVLIGSAGAVPPPPPNPGDDEISEGRRQADEKAARVGELTGQLTEATARLRALDDEVAAKMEFANKARVDLEIAQGEADRARRDADAAAVEAKAAGQAVEDTRLLLDEFAAASYQQGSVVGSVSAFFGSKSPEELLARAQLLSAVGGSSLNAMEEYERDRADKANKDSAARAALDAADRKQAAADDAKHTADAAQADAVRARSEQSEKAAALEQQRATVQGELDEALGAVGGLEAQREQYEQWSEQKRREEEAAAQQAASYTPPPVPAGGGPAPVGGDVETVVARATMHLGVRYSWGGGNYDGPTTGIRDGGVADSYGDYYSVGFDCSGLMMFAFAGVGVYLPHYSGYQYTAGRQVPLAQARRGDMLFWGPGGGTHVALYLGDGMMIEAPFSGASVRIAPVRYGGIMPYVTRLL
ncbi:NlpC/P60 family protein [Saccharothrix violaceirubra]|uniref:Cell wall-associated NlpC family hydrolase n=1 Tax=Saccharothrix violaceirubra TaxID=413306 RepID=A0A7W7WVC8_9PSEU|nr:NlpC/P60 family protein [Saccharothrix violaceirubra]MBB4964921.1 cell wall-associated NlpC family hydrolase [Saccharothrix violaceirubra]